MNIKDLQKEAHAIAKEKGWHDTPKSVGTFISLCHSELSEALEALRGNCPGVYQIAYENGKPDGFAVELADTVIRILDMAEYYQIDISGWTEETISETAEKIDSCLFALGLKGEKFTLPDYIAIAHKRLSAAYIVGRGSPDTAQLAFCIIVIIAMSKKYDIPLEEAIRVKMAYNRTRPYRHGGKAL